MNRAYLLIGGNMGNRFENLKKATNQLEKQSGKIIMQSRIYETAAWGITDQPSFLNQVLLLETSLNAESLLSTILKIETDFGRKRIRKFGPRQIDIDILFFNDDIISSSKLIVPHPEIQNRRFALVPLNEIAADFIHPTFKKSVAELLNKCTDVLEVNPF